MFAYVGLPQNLKDLKERGANFLSAAELIRSLSRNAKKEFWSTGGDDVGLIQSTKDPHKSTNMNHPHRERKGPILDPGPPHNYLILGRGKGGIGGGGAA